MTLVLGLEVIGIVSLIILYDKTRGEENLLYVSTTCYLSLVTIYFAWHSIVKENSFELVAFALTSSILNCIAIFLVIENNVTETIKICSIISFIVCQIIYYLLSVYTYRHFHNYLLNGKDESMFVKKLVAVRTFEMFLSMLKVDFLLYNIIIANYMFYVFADWQSFKEFGITIGCVGYLFLLIHTIIGIYAVSQERKKNILTYVLLMIVSFFIKTYVIVIVAVQPGKQIRYMLAEQVYVVYIGNLVVYASIIYLGYWTRRSFGLGAMSIIRKANDDDVKALFL